MERMERLVKRLEADADRLLLVPAEHTKGIVFKEVLITLADLAEDAQKMRGYSRHLTTKTDDLVILQELLRTAVPLTVIGDRAEEPLVLHAELGRFPIRSHTGNVPRETYAVRLVPEAGGIAIIVLNHSGGIAVNYVDDHQPDCVNIGLGNDLLHLSVYYQRTIKNLPPLAPFQKERISEQYRALRALRVHGTT